MATKRKFKKYAQSTSPSRSQQNDDPQPGKETTDYDFLIGALVRQLLEKGLMDNKFLKNFFLNKEDLRKSTETQKQIIEKKLLSCMRNPKKSHNEATIRLIEEFAKEKNISIEEEMKYNQYSFLMKPIVIQPTIFVTKDKEWLDIF